MKVLKHYQFEPSNVSQGIYAKLSLVRMGRNVNVLSVSARTSNDGTQVKEEFVVSVLEEECDVKDGEVYEIFIVPVWKNKNDYKANTITSGYLFMNAIHLENETYNVFYKKLN